ADIPAAADHPSRPTLERVADGLTELRVPTLLAWGPRDITFFDRFLRDLIERVPHADVHRFEGASHLVWEDADVAGLVARWLETTFGTAEEPRTEAPAWRPVSAYAEEVPAAPIGESIARLAADPVHAHQAAVV